MTAGDVEFPQPKVVDLPVSELPLHVLQLEAALAEGPCVYRAVDEEFEVVCIGGKLSVEGQLHLPHDACHGTGRVPLLPGLRKPCPRCRGSGIDMAGWSRYRPCQICGGAYKIYARSLEVPKSEKGRGWVAETSILKVFEVLQTSKLRFRLDVGMSVPFPDAHAQVGRGKGHPAWGYGRSEDAGVAFWCALVAWCRAQEVQREPTH